MFCRVEIDWAKYDEYFRKVKKTNTDSIAYMPGLDLINFEEQVKTLISLQPVEE
jgi:hypothetical protein